MTDFNISFERNKDILSEQNYTVKDLIEIAKANTDREIFGWADSHPTSVEIKYKCDPQCSLERVFVGIAVVSKFKYPILNNPYGLTVEYYFHLLTDEVSAVTLDKGYWPKKRTVDWNTLTVDHNAALQTSYLLGGRDYAEEHANYYVSLYWHEKNDYWRVAFYSEEDFGITIEVSTQDS